MPLNILIFKLRSKKKMIKWLKEVFYMRHFKKFGILLLAGVMIISFAACGQNNNAPAQSRSDQSASADTQQQGNSSDSTAAGSGKVLVAYYSASGNTARVAQDIADAAGADLFEITPVEPYTSDDLNWTDDNSRVSREHDDESLRDVELTTADVENWDQYDTVLIGYPIWWGIAAWPVDNFVKNNDFTGKTVIPFATSSSSGMGQSGDLLKAMAKGGDWQSGQRFSSGASSDTVRSWADSLNIGK